MGKLDDLLKLCKDCENPNRFHKLYSGLGGGWQEDLSETKLQLSDDKTETEDEEWIHSISCYIILLCMLCYIIYFLRKIYLLFIIYL